MALYRGPGGIGIGSVTTTPVQITEGGTGATSATDARTNLGLGTIATQNSNNVSITGGTVQNITDITVADGGTGASTAANARVNLLPSYTGNGSKVLALNSSANDVEWVTNGNGTVSSVGLTVPTGLAVTNSPITTSGNIDIAFDTGYSIPTTASQTNWDTAYGWGDHAVAGYLDAADIGVTVQAYDATIVVDADIGVTVQAYDADTAKYDDVTANFSGTLQNGGNTVLTTASTIEGGTY